MLALSKDKRQHGKSLLPYLKGLANPFKLGLQNSKYSVR